MRKILNISFVGLIFFVSSCRQAEKPVSENIVSAPTTTSTAQKTQPTVAAEPMFLSEGELTFLNPSGKEVSKLEIEIVDNDADRQKGLMFRKTMPEYRGMLFIFEEQVPQAFWMKNTLMPLDIIYVNDKNTVVSIQKNATPLSEKSLPSDAPAIYVVETNAGYSAKFGIDKGSKISFKKY